MSSSTKRKRHTPEQIIARLREAEAMLAGGKRAWEGTTYHLWHPPAYN